MKKMFLACAMIGALALAGCNTTAQDVASKITSTSQTATAKAKEVQDYAVQLCGYLPYASAVISIFNSGYSQNVATVGNAICSAVTNLPLADGPGKREPRVNGVLVQGKWVR